MKPKHVTIILHQIDIELIARYLDTGYEPIDDILMEICCQADSEEGKYVQN